MKPISPEALNRNRLVRLSTGLLQIASHAMPDTFFRSDSRCKLAREVLEEFGYDPEEFWAQIHKEDFPT